MTHTRLSAAALLLAAAGLSGCSTTEMKGTPFYTGEYQLNVPGADERRVNLWPLAYYREPALSVAWPVFEHTEDHVAVRPLFSAYGNTNAYWEYNVLWPLCQADTRGRDYRVFPCFWGETARAGDDAQAYHVLFPFLWHYEDETFSLFPLWLSDREEWSDGRFQARDRWLAWPLARLRTGARQQAWHLGPFGRYRYPERGATYTGTPWPLLFSWRTPEAHGRFTPLYAYEASDRPGVADGWDALPLLLSWRARSGDDRSLIAAGGLYGRLDRDAARSGWLLPLCFYDTRDRLLLTPLVGWDRPDDSDRDGYWYPFTPLAGVRTGATRGSWLFPLYDHRADPSDDTYRTRFLLLGHAAFDRDSGSDYSAERRNLGFFPLFSRNLYFSSRTDARTRTATSSVSRRSRNLLLHWSDSYEAVRRDKTPGAPAANSYRTRTADRGLFPLWSSESRSKSDLDDRPLSATRESAWLLALYDDKRNTVAASDRAPALDYVRRRVLWRVWHYERRNGDTSVDLFPFITVDRRADGFSKTSFLWRLFRHERSRDGRTSLDLLFLPLVRERAAPDAQPRTPQP